MTCICPPDGVAVRCLTHGVYPAKATPGVAIDGTAWLRNVMVMLRTVASKEDVFEMLANAMEDYKEEQEFYEYLHKMRGRLIYR